MHTKTHNQDITFYSCSCSCTTYTSSIPHWGQDMWNWWKCVCQNNKNKGNMKDHILHLSQTNQAHTHITFITFYWEIRLLIFNWLNGVCLVWSWYYGPVCFLPRVSWLKNLPLSTRCQIDTTVWLIHTHKRTCHNPRPPIGYCRSPVSKATLECLVCGTTPFRKQPHVNKPAMCSTVCSIWLCGKQSVTGCRQIEVDL